MSVEKDVSADIPEVDRADIEQWVEQLLREVNARGYVLTVERISDLPPAMGHGHYRMNLWKKRGAA